MPLKDENGDWDWDVPTSMEEARDRRLSLIAEVQEIQNQLGDRVKKAREKPEVYWKWRQSAKWALTNALQELRLVKRWIKEQSHEYAERP